MPEINAEIVGENAAPLDHSAPEINFSALKSDAAKYLDALDKPAEPVVETKPAEPEEHAEEASAETQTEEEPAQQVPAKLADIEDEATYKFPVNGVEQTISGKELKSRLSGEFHFTKKMQELAEQRKAFEATQGELGQLKEMRDNFRAFLTDENSIREFLKLRYPHLAPAEAAAAAGNAGDPNEIATVGDAQRIAAEQAKTFEQKAAEMQQALEQGLANVEAKIRFEEQKAKHDIAINSTLTDIFTKNPVLNAFPNAEQVIRFEVSKLVTPETTEAEALEYFQQVSADIVKKLGAHVTANKKVTAVAKAKAKLETKSIEPPGGAAPQLKPTNFKDADGKVDLNKVKNAARAYLDSL